MAASPLFLVGHGRSGTTATLGVLNGHPQIALGVERYKRLWDRRIHQVTPELFEHDRFFDFSDELTNLVPQLHERWASFYRDLEAKWDTATYVGDKMTQVHIRRMWRAMPEARFVCIVRQPEEVASSWNVRADNPNDRWSPTLDAREAVTRGNVALRRIRRARLMQPDKVVVVKYHRFFRDPDAGSLRKVLDFLGLDYHPEMAATFAATHADYRARQAKRELTLTPEESAFIKAETDWQCWRDLRRLAL